MAKQALEIRHENHVNMKIQFKCFRVDSLWVDDLNLLQHTSTACTLILSTEDISFEWTTPTDGTFGT